MNVYAESSAVLAWLLGEEASPRVRDVLASAVLVMASDLTLIECDRVLLASQSGRSPRFISRRRWPRARRSPAFIS